MKHQYIEGKRTDIPASEKRSPACSIYITYYLKIIYSKHDRNNKKRKWNEEMIVAVNAIYAIA